MNQQGLTSRTAGGTSGTDDEDTADTGRREGRRTDLTRQPFLLYGYTCIPCVVISQMVISLN